MQLGQTWVCLPRAWRCALCEEREVVLPGTRVREEVVREPSRGAPTEIAAAPGTCRVCPLAPEWAAESVALPHPQRRGM